MSGDPRKMMDNAEAMRADARKGLMVKFTGPNTEKLEKAADEYIKAANAFRMQKMNQEAGRAFEKAAEVQLKDLDEPDDAANTYTDAFKVYRKESPADAVRCIDKAITRYTDRGNFRRAAQHKENAGEVLEVDIGDTKRALEFYETAAEWYEGDNAIALANKLWIKVADLAALEGDYEKSIQQFERVAGQAINNNLMRYSVKDYFLKAGICHLCAGSTASLYGALERYGEIDTTFPTTRENQLLTDLAAAIDSGDENGFTDKLFQYDQMSKLDKWKTTLLLRVKGHIEAAGEDFS